MNGSTTVRQAELLVAGLLSEPWGRVSPSTYETARLVSTAPWLTGHAARIDFLLAGQRSDGAWGASDRRYALVPTLSATEALLSVATPKALKAADRALTTLSTWLRSPISQPDMPAIELIAPYLVAEINLRLARSTLPHGPLPFPQGMDDSTVRLIRERLAAHDDVPKKLLHALEIAGDSVAGHPSIHPGPTGTIGASPAATATWLAAQSRSSPAAVAFLEAAGARHGGPVPSVWPITVFERGWVVAWLARAGLVEAPPAALVRELENAVTATGAAGGDGLPTDADTTSGALYALALLGRERDPAMLLPFELDTHFCTWRGENGSSVTTNAHVLEAFGEYTRRRPSHTAAYAPTMAKVPRWLCEQQRPDGSWIDRWHASPYYATMTCALALHEFGGTQAREAVERAALWVLRGQRPDGAWGVWNSTVEETAYALTTLVATDAAAIRPMAVEQAVRRGRSRLTQQGPRPALWHDKELYLPEAVVEAAVLTAQHLVGARTATPV